MDEFVVQGFRPYSFTTKETGELLEGTTVFCSFEDEKITGSGVEKFSISNKKLGDFKLKVGQHIEAMYNKYGKVDGLRLLLDVK